MFICVKKMERKRLQKLKETVKKEKSEKRKKNADKVWTFLAKKKKKSVMLLFLRSMFDLDKELLINPHKKT